MPKMERLLEALNSSPSEYASLVVSFNHHLQSLGLSSETIYSYLMACRLLNDHLVRKGHERAVEVIDRSDVEGFIGSLLAIRSPATAANRYRSLQQFFKWCVEEDEITSSPMQNMKPPRVPEKIIPVISDEDLNKLVATCSKGKEFEDIRDHAILRLFITTGARRAEVANLCLEDLDMRNGEVFFLGKGMKPRVVPLEKETHRVLDKYLRIRARHPAGDMDALWISRQSTPLTHWGIEQMVRRRASQAGIEKIHLHQFRHTFADIALSRGMQESDLMRIAGWSTRQMIDRYGRANADKRARAAHRELVKDFPV